MRQTNSCITNCIVYVALGCIISTHKFQIIYRKYRWLRKKGMCMKEKFQFDHVVIIIMTYYFNILIYWNDHYQEINRILRVEFPNKTIFSFRFQEIENVNRFLHFDVSNFAATAILVQLESWKPFKISSMSFNANSNHM